MEELIGRDTEKKILLDALASNEAELVAVFGRRRVGKTFLVHTIFNDNLIFEFSGIHRAKLYEQLQNFSLTLQQASRSNMALAVPKNWIEAFYQLQVFLEPKIEKKKSVIFFDEFPWANTPKSSFLEAFGHFWNTWASRQPTLVVVICGSAASWIIRNVVNNKGGLHNRISRKIRLMPFTLGETEAFLKSRKINLDRYQILHVYMAVGGIPQYLKNIKPGESAAQAINRLCFSKDGLLMGEFTNLYASLFDNADHHIKIIKAIATKMMGLTRNEIINNCGLSSGGTTTKLLEELVESGFITPYVPFNKDTKESIYKLSDEYSLFYLKFMESTRAIGEDIWQKINNTASWRSWSGFVFENICLKHSLQLKKALDIAAVTTEESVWRYVGKDEKGSQIDLLIDRRDNCINICEMKYTNTEFTIDKNYAAELKTKQDVFREKTRTRKTLFLTMITTYGVKQNTYYHGLVQKELTMDALFI